MAHCLITGCSLYLLGDQSVWGDLHGCCDDTILVFDACVNSAGYVRWVYDYSWEPTSLEKGVYIEGDYFSRNGIFTFSAGAAIFSKGALQHLSRDPTWKKT